MDAEGLQRNGYARKADLDVLADTVRDVQEEVRGVQRDVTRFGSDVQRIGTQQAATHEAVIRMPETMRVSIDKQIDERIEAARNRRSAQILSEGVKQAITIAGAAIAILLGAVLVFKFGVGK